MALAYVFVPLGFTPRILKIKVRYFSPRERLMRLGRFTITALSANPDLDVRTAPDCRFSLRNLAIEHNRDNKHHELLIHRSIFFC